MNILPAIWLVMNPSEVDNTELNPLCSLCRHKKRNQDFSYCEVALLLLLLHTCFAGYYWHLSCMVIKCLDYRNIIVIVFNAPEKHFSYLCFRLIIDFLIRSLTCKCWKSLHTSDSRMCTGSCAHYEIYEIYYATRFQRIVFFIKPNVLQTVPLWWLQAHSPVTMLFFFFCCCPFTVLLSLLHF